MVLSPEIIITLRDHDLFNYVPHHWVSSVKNCQDIDGIGES